MTSIWIGWLSFGNANSEYYRRIDEDVDSSYFNSPLVTELIGPIVAWSTGFAVGSGGRILAVACRARAEKMPENAVSVVFSRYR
ncbi:hypothetical protein CGZ80_15985 [Rhodopirellula sp. MGV]|nr:hypothetical protein CGZ80_15985 [Rhodopirellula sp. MGV]PNY33591.1 hypothetical protein C2E31_27710 [Rhodopirellula baltica]